MPASEFAQMLFTRTTFPDAADVQLAALVTVKEYEFAASPSKVVVVPDPVVVEPPGLAVTIHVPDAGKPLRNTLPVTVEQVGCVIVPTVGAIGGEYTVTLTASVFVHPLAFVIVIVPE